MLDKTFTISSVHTGGSQIVCLPTQSGCLYHSPVLAVYTPVYTAL